MIKTMQTIKQQWKRLLATGLAIAMVMGDMTFAGSSVAHAKSVESNLSETNVVVENIDAAVASVGVGTTARTQAEIQAYIESSGAKVTDRVEYATEPSASAPYAPGSLTAGTLNSALAMLNQIRYIAGLPEVTLGTEYTAMEQAAALVNAANNVLSHYPTRPDGMDEDLYDLGRQGAGSSNIAMGYGTLNHAILDGWMADEDSSNIDRVGHRRWVLNPSMGKTSFGVVGRYYAMYSFDTSRSSSIKGVAWPAREMPIEYFANDYPWSYSFGSYISNQAAVQVVMTRQSDGARWTFSQSSADGDFYIDNGGYGQTGCIIFRPSSIAYHSGDTFEVEITGLASTVKYYVNFFKAVPEPEPTPLPVNTNVSGVLESYGKSIYSFTAPYTGTQTYTFYTVSSIDTYGTLYADKDCTNQLANNDDGGNDRNFRIVYNLAFGETVYLCVSGYGSASGSYIVRADGQGTPGEEPGDDPGDDPQQTITELLHAIETSGTLEAGVSNYYSFTAPSNGNYVFFTTSNMDTYGCLYNDASFENLLVSNDDSGVGNNFRITYGLTAGQTVYLEVKGYNENVIGDYTVTALREYTISFETSGGEGGPSTIYKLHGQDIILPENQPEKNGFLFQGWSISPNAAVVDYEAGAAYALDGDQILYAVWQEVDQIINLENGVPYDTHLYAGVTDRYRFTAPTTGRYEIYTSGNLDTYGTLYSDEEFSSYLDSDDDGGENRNFRIVFTVVAGQSIYIGVRGYNGNTNGDYTITVAKEYTISFDANGGTNAPSDIIKLHNIGVSLPVITPTRSGYEFLGWGTSATATTVSYAPGAQYTVNSDIRLYAIWKKEVPTIVALSHAVTYNATLVQGEGNYYSFTAPSDGTYVFFSSGSVDTIGKLYEDEGFANQIEISNDDGEGRNFQIRRQMTSGQIVYLEVIGNGVAHGNYSVTVAKEYTIRFNANGGTEVPANITKLHGVATTIPFDVPVRTGYEFLGWGTSATTTTVSYAPGDQYTANGSKTLYAIWKEVKNYIVTLNKLNAELPTNSTLQLRAVVIPGGYTGKYTWSSSDENVATVDSNGLVKALRYGKVVITVTLDNGKSAKCDIQTRFYDVAGSNVKGTPNYQYYYDPVYWAADNGITTGYDKVYFGPERDCERREMLIFLWRIAGCPTGYGDARKYFNDLGSFSTSSASNKAIAWAYKTGITKGYSDGGFHPYSTITRGETMILLYRVAGKPAVSGKITFPDVVKMNLKTTSDTYKAILWGSQKKITSGYSDGNFRPNDNCLREAIVTFLYRYNNLKK